MIKYRVRVVIVGAREETPPIFEGDVDAKSHGAMCDLARDILKKARAENVLLAARLEVQWQVASLLGRGRWGIVQEKRRVWSG